MNLDTQFSVDFGQLIEQHMDRHGTRENLNNLAFVLEIEVAELTQFYSGYDTPSTALVFEILRTLGSAELIDRFLKLPTVFGASFNNSSNINTMPEPKVKTVPVSNLHRPKSQLANELDYEEDDDDELY